MYTVHFIDFAQDSGAPRRSPKEELWFKGCPYRRMIGRLFHPADVEIDAGFDAALSQRRACQQQVDTQTAIVIETFRAVIEQ